jgi:hypothetical protein
VDRIWPSLTNAGPSYDVSAEEMGEGGQFKREIVVANFGTTNRVDCCDPSAGGHHDDD